MALAKLSPNFMAELFKLMFLDANIMRMVSGHLEYSLIPKEWSGYKFLLREALEQFNKRDSVPSLGAASQKFVDNEIVQETIDEIKKANIVDKELIIDQLESFIKETQFELLSKKVHDLYEEGKKEEAIRVNSEESKQILEISLRKTGGNFIQVFGGFEERMEFKRSTEMSNADVRKVRFGIDKLDEISYGGAEPGDTVLWIMRSGIGKALSLDSDIMTPTGSIKMKDIKVGDVICHPSGGTQSVIAIPYRGIDDCYRVTFSDGTSVKCNKNHLWTVINRNHSKKQQTYSLEELVEKGLYRPGYREGEKYKAPCGKITYGRLPQPRWRIPCHKIIDFKEQEVRLDPYTLGALLGDGNFDNNSTKFTSIDQEILNRLKFPEGLSIKPITGSKCCYIITGSKKKGVSSIASYLESYGLKNLNCWEKFIPEDYKFNSKEVRLEVLRGLLDTDGYVNKNGLIEIALTSKRLVEDIQFIARSLGCLCHPIYQKASHYLGKDGERIQCKDHFRLRIVPPKGLSLFHLSKKKEPSMQSKKLNCRWRAIKKVEYIGKEEQQCITVSNPDGLFLTNDFIVTHNSTMLRWHGFCAALEGEPVLHIQLEGSREDTVDKYDQIWTAQSYMEIKQGNIKQEDLSQILKTCKDMQQFGKDISVYGFARYGESSMGDIRNLCFEYQKIFGHFPRLVILDSLDLAASGTSKKLDNDPEFLKYKLQKNAQLFKDLMVEIKAVGITATQASNVPIEIWNNEDKIIDRSYTEGDKTLVKPFSFVFTGNVTILEKKEKRMRIYIDKLRDYRDAQLVFTIATDFDRGRAYHRGRTMELYYNKVQEAAPVEKEKLTKSKRNRASTI